LRVLLFVSMSGLWFAWLLTLSARSSAWLVFGSALPLLALISWIAHRGHPESWRSFIRRTADVHVLTAVSSVRSGSSSLTPICHDRRRHLLHATAEHALRPRPRCRCGFNRIAFERRSGTAPIALYRFAVD
jgi:hypothetical protein